MLPDLFAAEATKSRTPLPRLIAALNKAAKRKSGRRGGARLLLFCATVSAWTSIVSAAPAEEPQTLLATMQQFCFDCHDKTQAEAGVNLESLASDRESFATDFRTWRKANRQLADATMPPREAEQPDAATRQRLLAAVQHGLRRAAERREGDPGHVVMRRLTSAEYAYTIRDLTGLDLALDRGFVSDAVGGSGFTNTGIVQFLQDSTLERYLEAAQKVADHAVVGAGPLTFHQDPGQTGFELSAISRIQKVYRQHGFRTAAGEGGEAFGLNKYPRAFFTAWLYEHRKSLDRNGATFAELAAEQHIDTRFAEYMHGVLSQQAPTFPISDIVERWKGLPAPQGSDPRLLKSVRKQCGEIARAMHRWQRRFGANADAKEEAPVLREDLFDVTRTQPFEMNINWPTGTKTAHLVLSVESAIEEARPQAIVVWKQPKILFRIENKRQVDARPLKGYLTPAMVNKLGFGKHPRGGEIAKSDFVTVGTAPRSFELPIPANARSARLSVTATLDTKHGQDCIVRCTIAQLEETDQGKSVSGLLANPEQPAFAAWKAGVLDFARKMPQVSQREPAPSDRDPIPPPFDGSYNNPERNEYHTRIKYFRDDDFLIKNVLDASTRKRLRQAWADLLGSFEFHDAWLRFVARKYEIDLNGRSIVDVDDRWIRSLPQEAQRYVRNLHREHLSIQRAFANAEPSQIDDVLSFAARAWRRPLSSEEQRQLRDFYEDLRADRKLGHRRAIRAMIARVLVAPAFLYRAERSSGDDAKPRLLSDWELASRLSYFLWSSSPDPELRRAAAAGELQRPKQLASQARRMLKDPKARRFSREFFGQWFGFYRFDQHRGVDPKRFPEFTDVLRSAMHDEAVLFFDHIVRNDRPLDEILFADYSFLSAELAAHYQMPWEPAEGDQSGFRKIENVGRFHRGGLLRLGAVLTVTSAPLRTSPVKRGDWILRRALGSPVPPPPADAGSIPADDNVGDGLSVRQRLEAHRREASCVNCHSRIDALGFALEKYDPLGRWRERYRDGTPIETAGELRDGAEIRGDEGLHRYLAVRKGMFHRTLAVKLLGYALGRREEVGDAALVSRMTKHLSEQGDMQGLVERIVVSRQFRYHGAGKAAKSGPASLIRQ